MAYPPCLHMADWALLAWHPWYQEKNNTAYHWTNSRLCEPQCHLIVSTIKSSKILSHMSMSFFLIKQILASADMTFIKGNHTYFPFSKQLLIQDTKDDIVFKLIISISCIFTGSTTNINITHIHRGQQIQNFSLLQLTKIDIFQIRLYRMWSKILPKFSCPRPSDSGIFRALILIISMVSRLGNKIFLALGRTYTKFHSPRPVFHSPGQIFTRIGERASASFPAWVPTILTST